MVLPAGGDAFASSAGLPLPFGLFIIRIAARE